MHVRTWPATALALLGLVGAAVATRAQDAAPAQADGPGALGGEWLYVEDLTEGRAVESQGPPMSVTFGMRVEEDAVVMLRGQGAQRREERIALDGSAVEEAEAGKVTITRGEWKDGLLEYVIEVVRESDGELLSLIRREFRSTPEGMQVRVVVGDPAKLDSLALYRHPEDIPLPAPARGTIADMEWLAGAWVGTRGQSSIEERWSPPSGGAMLGVSRTVRGDRMVGFEYLRVVERDGGLVYVAQPGGNPPTEFVLTALDGARAVFENPRHDSPQRIEYRLSAEGALSVSVGFANGGRPTVFEFTRAGD